MGKKLLKMTFEVAVDQDIMIDEETLAKEYGGDIHACAAWLYKEEGYWWDKEMTLTKTEIINK